MQLQNQRPIQASNPTVEPDDSKTEQKTNDYDLNKGDNDGTTEPQALEVDSESIGEDESVVEKILDKYTWKGCSSSFL